MPGKILGGLAGLVACVLASSATAQTISQPLANGHGGTSGFGQSFTATLTGTLTAVQVRPRANTPTSIYFYNGTGSGIDRGVGTPAHSQSVTLIDQGSDTTGFQTIVLTTPLPIIAGDTYSFAFGDSSLASNVGDVYGGGIVIAGYNFPNPGLDLAFTATEVATPVPTLSEWAMILLGLSLAGGAAVVIERRRMTA